MTGQLRDHLRGRLVLAVVALAVAGCTAAQGAPQAGPFAWFTAGPPPSGWHTASLPGQQAVLSYPPTAHPIEADPGAVAEATVTPTGDFVTYLNATPQQGDESLANWPRFRIDHLTDESARSVTLTGAATGLAFQGGTGSCVQDDYTTVVGSHHYREIACLVSGAHGDSVVVAATLAADWPREHALLEQAVDSYVTR
jgi:hypothetical protein